MVKNNLIWKIGGEAGFGIMSSGAIFAKTCIRQGLFTADYVEYPSLIRGGHNLYTVCVSDHKLYAPHLGCDVLVAFNTETITKHEHELSPGGAILYDTTMCKNASFTRSDLVLFDIPFRKLAGDLKGDSVMVNGVAVGASLALIGSDFNVLAAIFQEMFARKGEAVVNLNVAIAQAGYQYIAENYADQMAHFGWKIERQDNESHMLISGTEAVAVGAMKAGLKFFSAYPMTPISNILAYIVGHDEEFGIIYKQPEDEIAAINMAIGASYAGARSLTATAGGGFALMTEGVGLAAMTETPLVIILGMRPGPATGLPTWTGQADLRMALHAGQDEFPRVVLAPGDVEEAFYLTYDAFNFADKTQGPVIILVDKMLLESHWSERKLDMSGLVINRGELLTDDQASTVGDDYLRYKLTDTGVSPRKVPGQPGRPFLGGSDEHSENSIFDEEADNRVKMMDKRFKKIELARADIPEPKLYGPEDAPITIVGFGSTKLPVLEAFKELNKEQTVANYLHFCHIWPLPVKKIQELVQAGKKLVIFEGNYSGQLAGLLREYANVNVPRVVVKYDGRQFYPEEIVEQIQAYEQVDPNPAKFERIVIGGKS